MQYLLQLFEQNRKNIIALLTEHSIAGVNTIPPGSNNNLIWNAGHLLLSQQFLMYHFSGLPLLVPAEEMLPKYGSNTSPDGNATLQELDQLLDLLGLTTQRAIEDYNHGIFKTYKGYTSEYFGISMKTIEEALHFNTAHEAFHFGCMTAQKAALANT